MKKIHKKKILLLGAKCFRRIWFHLLGIACLIWFVVRVAPAPHRVHYPCQQVSKSIAYGYIAFWGALMCGLTEAVRQLKTRIKTTVTIPSVSVVFITVFAVIGMVFAGNYLDDTTDAVSWNPIPKDPIGTPTGINPGRVVWIWDPDATESELVGRWWETENNNQMVIDSMLSSGLQNLTNERTDQAAWNALFTYFNQLHGRGSRGYQEGEKIAIKINMNNCYDSRRPYTREDNDRDASPFVVKALLRELVESAGIHQEDITVYDASRPLSDWFYNRVYYETYPATPLVPEFPDINFVDSIGGADGRQKVTASTTNIYFADASGLIRTLPICVVDADYIINMPLLKKHPLHNGVTLAGKNMYGTWIEPVSDVHEYHEAAHTLGNPAPHTDLLAHEHIGGKTLLYIADGMYGTLADHRRIDKFQMYPFNDDWTSSLFFSQDPVALDSVMYDFLHAEGTNPSEGAQNYLHQAAEPPLNVYDPENDGRYLMESLGVHEHWDTSVDIFSLDRYSGVEDNGIDFLALGGSDTSTSVRLLTPKENCLYILGREITAFPWTVIIGKIDVEAVVHGLSLGTTVDKVEFYVDNNLKHTDYEEPYAWLWDEAAMGSLMLNATVYDTADNVASDEIKTWVFNI